MVSSVESRRNLFVCTILTCGPSYKPVARTGKSTLNLASWHLCSFCCRWNNLKTNHWLQVNSVGGIKKRHWTWKTTWNKTGQNNWNQCDRILSWHFDTDNQNIHTSYTSNQVWKYLCTSRHTNKFLQAWSHDVQTSPGATATTHIGWLSFLCGQALQSATMPVQ